mgnify:CR=1 FL=1
MQERLRTFSIALGAFDMADTHLPHPLTEGHHQGFMRQDIEQSGNTCLLYTSPSPRDTR